MPYNDPEKRRIWDEANREKLRETTRKSQRRRRAENPEAAREYARKWRAANREKERARASKYNAKNAEARRAYNMRAHPEQYRAAYDPNCRPFPARFDPEERRWVKVEKVVAIPAPTHFTPLDAALVVIDAKLWEEEGCAAT